MEYATIERAKKLLGYAIIGVIAFVVITGTRLKKI
jgi:hypothetical protein|nr:MAG TPA: hypothetical protein [Caudoviricetes sp.]